MSDEALIKIAIDARGRAYAPYSGYAVGASILDENGQIHSGQNIENASYPNGICAEAAAISAMISAGGRHIVTLAVSGGDGQHLCTPCGSCRQRIREFSLPDTQVLVADDTGLKARFLFDELLPSSFGPENMD
jgi:cytidine deaminase